MTGANHVATGAVIGASLAAPVVVPLAIASHFVLDALPHFGDENLSKRSKRFMVIITIDALLIAAITTSIIVLKPRHWQLMLIGGVLAASPDLMWAPSFVRTLRQRAHKPHNRLMRWHHRIQREYAWGLITEVAWLLLVAPFLVHAL
jgi:hypothetical protein